jgi:5-methyltetrahydropteroyltriglutamate--homocysteine methyltransferase
MSEPETRRPRPTRAEGVGSLLRPAPLKRVFDQAYGGALHVDVLSDERKAALGELDRLAAAETPELVRRQLEAGLDVVTDGELRRGFFANSIIDAVAGIDVEHTVRTTGSASAAGEAVPVVARRISKRGNPALREAQTLSGATTQPKKITFPAASFFYFQMVLEVDPAAYPDRDRFLEDMLVIQREVVEEVIDAGIDHVQFDFPVYPMLVDEQATVRAAALGETPESLLEKALAVDERLVAGLPPHVTTALHVCRGNQIRFFSGSLEPIAERVFSLPYDRFLVEWHDVDVDGGYDAIRFVPARRVMVMGLISTKTPEVETEDDVLARLDRAASFLDLAQLAISPQCGFASTWHGHRYGEEIQWRKLELAGRVAARLWDGN